jgi:DNA polymerase alpha subunit B
VAKDISTASAKPMKTSAPTASVFTKPVSAVIASGPFSCAKDLKYEPLNDLLDFVATENPDVLILCGPLVDVENAIVKTGSCGDLDFDDVALNVTQTIERKLGFNAADSTTKINNKTKVVYVPSIRDAMLDAAFPQPAPKREAFFTSSTRAFVASNPGTFEINGAVFSVVTHDILKHLSVQEISKGFAPKERLNRLATHVASQANAYPLYPTDPSACFDAAHGDALALDVTPDVLILPSDLKTFAEVLDVRDVGKVVCINPGRLARGESGGTLAKLIVHAAPAPTPDEDAPHD